MLLTLVLDLLVTWRNMLLCPNFEYCLGFSVGIDNPAIHRPCYIFQGSLWDFPPMLSRTLNLIFEVQNCNRWRSSMSDRFLVPRCKFQAFSKSFYYGTLFMWASFPDKIKVSRPSNAFERDLLSYYGLNEGLQYF